MTTEIHLRPKANNKWDVVRHSEHDFIPSETKLVDTVTGEEAARRRGHEVAEQQHARLIIHPRDDAAITSEHVLEEYGYYDGTRTGFGPP